VSQPYPGQYQGAYPPVPYSAPKYRPLRRIALVSIGLIGLTCIASVIQSVLLWTSYEDVKRFVYGLLSEEEIDNGIETVAGAGPFLDLAGYLFLATGIAFLIWLWQARENTEILRPAFATTYQAGYTTGSGAHRHAQGWTIGGWVCPIVQFWYPLEVVQDVVRASEPPTRPGMVDTGGVRGLLYGWWAAWTTFWVIVVGGGGVAVVSFFVWIIRLVDRADAAQATGDYVDIYDLQDFMVRVALAVNIGFTVATVLLIVAAITISLLLLRVTSWQDARGPELGPTLPAHSPSYPTPGHLPGGPAPAHPQVGPPQYAPRPYDSTRGTYGSGGSGYGNYGPGPGGYTGPPQPPTPPGGPPPAPFPTDGSGQHQPPPGGTPPWHRPR